MRRPPPEGGPGNFWTGRVLADLISGRAPDIDIDMAGLTMARYG